MSRYDQNSGPLTLVHDPTPRGLDQNYNSPITNAGSFRFKGFPGHNFDKPTIPRTIPHEVNSTQTNNDEPTKVDLRRPSYDDYDSNEQNISIRNAHEKSVDQIRKETEQFRDRQEQEKKYKEESLVRLHEKLEDQRRVREMMEAHEPFGKPGAGAPNANGYDNKKQKFVEEQLSARDPPKYYYEPPSGSISHTFQFWDSFGRPGHGAPLRTDSGNLKTHLVGDVVIRFQDRYLRDIENHRQRMRPQKEKKKYYEDLRQQEQEKKSNGFLSSPIRPPGFNYMDYFGRAGPGSGAPMISDSGHVKAQYQCKDPSIFFQNPDMAREQGRGLDGMPPFSSPGRQDFSAEMQHQDKLNHLKDNLNQLRKENDVLERRSPDPYNSPDAYLKQKAGFGPNYGDFYPKRGIGSPRSAPDTHQPIDNPYDNLGKSRPALKPNREYLPTYDPFGKSGAGAPRKDPSGNRVTQIQGLMDRSIQEEERMKEKAEQERYRTILDKQMAERKRKEELQIRHQNEGQYDYAELMFKNRPRPRSRHPLPHSDVSRARDGRVLMDAQEAQKLYDALAKGSSEKQTKIKLDRMKDFQEARRHHDVMEGYWGRWGGGNKKHESLTQKGNLENLLNNADKMKAYEMNAPWAQH